MPFVPDKPKASFKDVPFFEDSAREDVPGRATKKSVEILKNEVASAITRLGGADVRFISGTESEPMLRHGFRIEFTIYQNPARLICLALPMKTETERKKDRALAQALYLLRDELVALYFSSMHKPSSDLPLIHALIGKGDMTIGEYLTAGEVPLLGPGESQ